MQLESTRSSRREYQEWIDEQLEDFKDSVPRADLLRIADEVVEALRATKPGQQYQLTEIVLCEAFDKRLMGLLELPSYRKWRAARRPRRNAPPTAPSDEPPRVE